MIIQKRMLGFARSQCTSISADGTCILLTASALYPTTCSQRPCCPLPHCLDSLQCSFSLHDLPRVHPIQSAFATHRGYWTGTTHLLLYVTQSCVGGATMLPATLCVACEEEHSDRPVEICRNGSSRDCATSTELPLHKATCIISLLFAGIYVQSLGI